jgi:hypothetical protein
MLTRQAAREEPDRELAALPEQLRQLHSQATQVEQELSTKESQMERGVSSKSEARTNVFREMIELASDQVDIGCSIPSGAQASMIEQNPHAGGGFKTRRLYEYRPK